MTNETDENGNLLDESIRLTKFGTILRSSFWWTAYNKIKHERITKIELEGVTQESFRFANQKYTLLALAGLYQIMVYFFYLLATKEGEIVVTPIKNRFSWVKNQHELFSFSEPEEVLSYTQGARPCQTKAKTRNRRTR